MEQITAWNPHARLRDVEAAMEMNGIISTEEIENVYGPYVLISLLYSSLSITFCLISSSCLFLLM